jgi:superfamily II DNA or RNA helicase
MAVRVPRELWNALRPYQRAAVDAMIRYIGAFDRRHPRAGLVHMPTGSGKTAVIASLARCFERSGPVLVIAPRIGLREQLARDIQTRFFEHARVNVGLLPRRVVELDEGSSNPGRLDDLVLVTTVQMLTSISKRAQRLARELQQRTVLVLFDEGHYEPAAVWSQVVRSHPCPRVVFTATAFRDDFKLFDIDSDHVYRYTFDRARRERYVRNVQVHPYAPVGSPAQFTQQVVDAYDRFFRRAPETNPRRPRAIIRCDKPEEIRQIAAALRNLNRSAIGIHETFAETPAAGEYRKVPNPDNVDATFWVHQFKLLEGIDDARFQLLALYRELRGMRAFVQQVGRVIRNPGQARGASAHVLDHSQRHRQTQLWDEFLAYDKLIERGDPAALELNRQSLVESLQKALPGLVYLNGRLRAPVELTELDIESLQLPLSTNIFEKPAQFSLEEAQRDIARQCTENDLICHHPTARSGTAVVFYVRVGTSPFLETSFLAEPRLGVSLVHETQRYLFVFDSGASMAADAIDAVPIDRSKLRRLFVRSADTRLTHVSMNNSNLGADQVRARAMTAVSVDRLAPSFDEHGYVLSTATGYSRGRRGNNDDEERLVRRYIGTGSGRVSDLGGGFVPFDAWAQWTAELSQSLDRTGPTLQVFRRWASDAPVPNNPSPVNVLLDVSDVMDRYRSTGDDQLPAGEPMELPELCVDVRNGRFSITANGRDCEVEIAFDRSRQTYQLNSPDLDIRYHSADPDNSQSVIRYLNRTQSLRVIPATSGFFYTQRQFCRPLVHFGPDYDDAKMGILSSSIAIPALRNVVSEKGRRCRPNGRGWEAGCLFDVIDSLGAGTGLETYFEGTDILVCDDPGDECADFILVQRETPSHRKRVVFIHAKASRDRSVCSASALQDVCAQAQKNLREVSIFSEGSPSKRAKWGQVWQAPPHTEGIVHRRIRRRRPGSDPEEDIRRTVKDPSADREVWLMVGNLLRKDALARFLRSNAPPGYAVQAAYLLSSTISNVAAAGARLTMFCG